MDDVLNILFVANGFPPTRWAGVETYTAAIAGEFMKIGYNVQVLCGGEWNNGANYWNGYVDDVYNGIPVRRINLNWKKSPDPQKYLYNNPVVAEFLDQYLNEINPDMVHITSCETLSASVLDVVKKHRIPLVLSITDFWFLCPRINLLRSDGENCDGNTTPWDCLQCTAQGSTLYRLSKMAFPGNSSKSILTKLSTIPLITRQRGVRGMMGDMADRKQYMRHAFSLPDARLVASRFVMNIHTENGFDDPIQLHPYGHDLSWLENYHGKSHSNTVNVGFIGQIAESKGVHLILEAARRLQDATGEKVNFLIYGNLYKHPAYARRLEELAEGLENIQFCGIYPREMSADVFSKMDVLVVPSLWYDFPLIIHEAFATKTPVIATNLGGMAEAVSHEINGLLFERGNVDNLVDQIQRIVDEPDLLPKLQAGIPKVRSIHEDISEMEKIYQELFQRQARSTVKEH